MFGVLEKHFVTVRKEHIRRMGESMFGELENTFGELEITCSANWRLCVQRIGEYVRQIGDYVFGELENTFGELENTFDELEIWRNVVGNNVGGARHKVA